MKRTTVRAGNHWIEVNRTTNGWEIAVIPMRDNPKGIPVDEQIVPTYKKMLQWVMVNTGQYVAAAIEAA